MTLLGLVKRHTKLFFKDKGLLFSSLITPAILLVLYITFLGNIYESTFIVSLSNLTDVVISDKVINGIVGGELVSSLLAVCCVTVSVCANMVSVNDKMTGALNDMLISPVKKSTLALSYYISTFINTLIIVLIAMTGGFIYLAFTGWYLGFLDVLLIIMDVVILSFFGTAISSLLCIPLKSQGGISAVGTIVSSGYGFICGAYMPISNFSKSLQHVLMFLPGTYGTSIIRNHLINGSLDELNKIGAPSEAITEMRTALDCNIYFFNNRVPIWVMYLVLIASTVLLVAAYVLITNLKNKKAKKN